MAEAVAEAKKPVPRRVYDFIRSKTPQPVCDECVSKSIGPAQNVTPLTLILGLTTDFNKTKGVCSVCQREKMVIRSLRYA